MLRKFSDVAVGFLIVVAALLGLLIWEWSCEPGAWAADYSICDFWNKALALINPTQTDEGAF